jgi:hypothetical protein
MGVDEGIDPPEQWQLVVRHLPWRHVAAIYDGDIGRISTAAMPQLRG